MRGVSTRVKQVLGQLSNFQSRPRSHSRCPGVFFVVLFPHSIPFPHPRFSRCPSTLIFLGCGLPFRCTCCVFWGPLGMLEDTLHTRPPSHLQVHREWSVWWHCSQGGSCVSPHRHIHPGTPVYVYQVCSSPQLHLWLLWSSTMVQLTGAHQWCCGPRSRLEFHLFILMWERKTHLSSVNSS